MVEFVLEDSGVMARLDVPSWWDDGVHAVRDVENEHDEQVNEQVNEQMGIPDRLLRLLREDDQITYQVAATRLAVSISTVRRAMKVLVNTGKVQRFGSDKKGRWVVLPEEEV